jgi:hypothetical protein
MARSASSVLLVAAAALLVVLPALLSAQSLTHPFGGDTRARTKFEKCIDTIGACRLSDLPRCCDKFKQASEYDSHYSR